MKHGKNKGNMTFNHKKVDFREILKLSKEMIIPFLQKCNCTELRVDCLKSFHHPKVIELYQSHGILVYPSAGYPHSVPNGYPPNSHDLMPNEAIHGELKNQLGKLLDGVPLLKRSPNKIYSLLPQAAQNVKLETIRAHIDKLENVCFDILMKDGGTMKY